MHLSACSALPAARTPCRAVERTFDFGHERRVLEPADLRNHFAVLELHARDHRVPRITPEQHVAADLMRAAERGHLAIDEHDDRVVRIERRDEMRDLAAEFERPRHEQVGRLPHQLEQPRFERGLDHEVVPRTVPEHHEPRIATDGDHARHAAHLRLEAAPEVLHVRERHAVVGLVDAERLARTDAVRGADADLQLELLAEHRCLARRDDGLVLVCGDRHDHERPELPERDECRHPRELTNAGQRPDAFREMNTGQIRNDRVKLIRTMHRLASVFECAD